MAGLNAEGGLVRRDSGIRLHMAHFFSAPLVHMCKRTRKLKPLALLNINKEVDSISQILESLEMKVEWKSGQHVLGAEEEQAAGAASCLAVRRYQCS